MRAGPWSAAALAVAWLAAGAMDATAQTATGRVLVMPLDTGRDARLYWMGEAGAILLAEDLSALGVDAITREERERAFERLQVPAVPTLSHGTVIRIGQLVRATTVVLGSLSLEADEIVVRARTIRLDTGRATPSVEERGPLGAMFATVERVARRIAPPSSASTAQIEQRHPPLTAFENYVKGLLAETPATRASYLEKAIAQHARFDDARLALWRVLFDDGKFDEAREAVGPVPADARAATAARFAEAVAAAELEEYDEAFEGLKALADATTLPEAFNNLGVIQLRRGGEAEGGRAAYWFTKATEADGGDADYFFNLGYAYWRERDVPAALYWLREALRRDPADGDAHYLLGVALQASGRTAEADREKELARRLSSEYDEWEQKAKAGEPAVPPDLERLRTYLQPAGGRRVDRALEAPGQRDQQQLAAFHLDRGRRFYGEERDRDAIAELRRVVFLSPYHEEAHRLLGRLYLRGGRVRDAIDELQIAVWVEESAEGHAALAQALLRADDPEGARRAATRALELDETLDEAKRVLAALP